MKKILKIELDSCAKCQELYNSYKHQEDFYCGKKNRKVLDGDCVERLTLSFCGPYDEEVVEKIKEKYGQDFPPWCPLDDE